MTTAYRYAWIAAIDEIALESLQKEMLKEKIAPPPDAIQPPAAIFIIHWEDVGVRLGLRSLDCVAGTDPATRLLVIGTDGDEEQARTWLESDPYGRLLKNASKALHLLGSSAEVLR